MYHGNFYSDKWGGKSILAAGGSSGGGGKNKSDLVEGNG